MGGIYIFFTKNDLKFVYVFFCELDLVQSLLSFIGTICFGTAFISPVADDVMMEEFGTPFEMVAFREKTWESWELLQALSYYGTFMMGIMGIQHGNHDDLMIGICQICWRDGGSVGICTTVGGTWVCILMSGKLIAKGKL